MQDTVRSQVAGLNQRLPLVVNELEVESNGMSCQWLPSPTQSLQRDVRDPPVLALDQEPGVKFLTESCLSLLLSRQILNLLAAAPEKLCQVLTLFPIFLRSISIGF